MHPGQGVARDGRGVPRRRRRRASSASSAGEPTARLRRHPGRASSRSSTSWSRASPGLLKRRKVTVFDGVGSLGADHVVKVTGGESGDVELTGTHVILATGSVPRTIPGFEVDGEPRHDLRRGAVARSTLPAAAVGHRWRRHRLRVRLDDRRPRHRGDDPRGACPRSCPGCDDDVANVVVRSRSRRRASTIRTGVTVTGHTPNDRRRHHGALRRRRVARRRPRRRVGRSPAARRTTLGLDGTAVEVERARLRRGRRVLPHRRARRVRRRRPHRHAAAGPRRLRRGHPRRSRTSSARTRCRSTTPGCRGPSTATPRSPSPATAEAVGQGGRLRRRRRQAPLRRQRPGPDPRRDRGPGEDHRREARRRHRRPDPRRAHGRPVGHRAARPGLPGRQLGGHRRRGRRVHPAPPDASASCSARRVLSLTGRACTADPTRTIDPSRGPRPMADIRCPNSVRPSPRAPSPSGSSRSATPSPRTSRSSRSRPTRSTPRCPSPVAGVLTEIRVPEGDTVDVGTVIAVVGDAGAAPGRPPRPPPRPSRPPRRAERRRPRPSPPRRPRRLRPPPPRRPPLPPAPAAGPRPGARRRRAGRRADGTAGKLLSPVVRRLVDEHGLDPAAHHRHRPRRSHHPRRRASRRSEPACAAAPAPAAAPAAGSGRPPRRPGAAPVGARAGRRRRPRRGTGDTVEPLNNIRRLTGEHMVMSKATSPHAFTVVEVDYENVERVRRRHRDGVARPSEGFSLTYLPFISRAVIDALREFPHLNASRRRRRARRAQLRQPRHRRRPRLRGPARPGRPRAPTTSACGPSPARSTTWPTGPAPSKLSADEIAGGTFTISNSGSFGTLPGDADHQPAAGGDPLHRRRAPQARSWSPTPDGGEAIAIHSVGNLAMSWDHRAFDGAYAAGVPRARSRRSSRPATGRPSCA